MKKIRFTFAKHINQINPNNVNSFKIVQFYSKDNYDFLNDWLGVYKKSVNLPYYYYNVNDSNIFFQWTPNLYDKGGGWCFYNHNYTTDPYYFTRFKNPFATKAYFLTDDDFERAATVTFREFNQY